MCTFDPSSLQNYCADSSCGSKTWQSHRFLTSSSDSYHLQERYKSDMQCALCLSFYLSYFITGKIYWMWTSRKRRWGAEAVPPLLCEKKSCQEMSKETLCGSSMHWQFASSHKFNDLFFSYHSKCCWKSPWGHRRWGKVFLHSWQETPIKKYWNLSCYDTTCAGPAISRAVQPLADTYRNVPLLLLDHKNVTQKVCTSFMPFLEFALPSYMIIWLFRSEMSACFCTVSLWKTLHNKVSLLLVQMHSVWCCFSVVSAASPSTQPPALLMQHSLQPRCGVLTCRYLCA